MLEKQKSENSMPLLEELVSEIDRKIAGEHSGQFSLKPELSERLEQESLPRIKYGKRKQYVRFSLEDILLAIPLSSALEISHRPDITPLPNLPDWVLGVSNIRGEIISIVDLKIFFGMSLHKRSHLGISKMVIILHNHKMKVGITVDRIMGIFSPDRIDAEIQDSPYKEGDAVSSETGRLISYISGVVPLGKSDKHLLNILDTDKLLTSPRMTAFRSEN